MRYYDLTLISQGQVLQSTERVWERHLAEPFNALQFEWLRWIGSAASRIQARLRDDDVM